MRVGDISSPRQLIDEVNKLQDNSLLQVDTISQNRRPLNVKIHLNRKMNFYWINFCRSIFVDQFLSMNRPALGNCPPIVFCVRLFCDKKSFFGSMFTLAISMSRFCSYCIQRLHICFGLCTEQSLCEGICPSTADLLFQRFEFGTFSYVK